MEAFQATCGHMIPANPPGHTGGTGYGTDRLGRTSCYACCNDAGPNMFARLRRAKGPRE